MEKQPEKNKYDWSIYDGETLLAYKKRDSDPVVIPQHQDKLIKKMLQDYYERLNQPDFKDRYYKNLELLNDTRSECRKLHEHCQKFAKEVALKEAMFTEYEKVLWYVFDDLMTNLGEKSFELVDNLFKKAREKRNKGDGTW
jgi:hypothetical protein